MKGALSTKDSGGGSGRGHSGQHDLDGVNDGFAVGRHSGGGDGFFFVGFKCGFGFGGGDDLDCRVIGISSDN